MIATYIILKITFQAIVDEANRMASDQLTRERAALLKSRVMQLDIDYESGVISEEEYGKRQSEILAELSALSASQPQEQAPGWEERR